MKYTTDNNNEASKIKFRTLNLGDLFRLGSTLYLRVDEIEVERDYNNVCYNAVDIRYGEFHYIENDDVVERYEGEIVFKEDDFRSSWN